MNTPIPSDGVGLGEGMAVSRDLKRAVSGVRDGEISAKAARALRKRARREQRIEPCEPVCVECGKLALHVKGDTIYPHRPDLHRKNFYLCECGAYVGCHPFTRIALGRPAGPVTRAARGRAHNCFDILWRRKMRVSGCAQSEAREAAYAWLGAALGYEPGKCHVGWMTAAEANRVVAFCNPYVHPARTPQAAEEIPGNHKKRPFQNG